MKLTICDRCSAVINNPSALNNTATIGRVNYDLCDSCLNFLTRNMKLGKEENREEIIVAIIKMARESNR